MHPAPRQRRFVCAMEEVLEVYHRQYGDNEVLVCLDGTSKQQVKETRPPKPVCQKIPEALPKSAVPSAPGPSIPPLISSRHGSARFGH